MADLVRWSFYDPLTLETYVFEINPKQGGSPGVQKAIGYQKPAGPGGRMIVFEGMDEAQVLAWEGTILTQEHYEALYTWAKKRYQIEMTDDLGRHYWVYISKFVPTRVRAASHRWKHTYTAEAPIVDWEWE